MKSQDLDRWREKVVVWDKTILLLPRISEFFCFRELRSFKICLRTKFWNSYGMQECERHNLPQKHGSFTISPNCHAVIAGICIIADGTEQNRNNEHFAFNVSPR